jgi:hypothetical protein
MTKPNETSSKPLVDKVVDKQGNLNTLDASTESESQDLQRQMGSAPTNWPFIWGTIRILAIYGEWSWWSERTR